MTSHDEQSLKRWNDDKSVCGGGGCARHYEMMKRLHCILHEIVTHKRKMVTHLQKKLSFSSDQITSLAISTD